MAMATTLEISVTETKLEIASDPPTTFEVNIDPAVEIIEVGTQGPAGVSGGQGPQGPQGAQGPAGTGGDLTYVHNQLASATVWNVAHNLGKYSNVTVVDSGNTVVIGDVEYVDVNNLIITFSDAFGGKAYIN